MTGDPPRERPGPGGVAVVAGIGFAAQVFQVLALREALGQVEGSEMAVGVSLAGWLLGGAAGAVAGRRAERRLVDPGRSLAAVLPAAALLATAALLAVRFTRAILPLAPGQPPGLAAGLAVAGLGGFVPALGYGFAFPLGARLLGGAGAYAVEAAGALAGGALFTFLLAGAMPPLGIAALLLGLSGALSARRAPLRAIPVLVAGLVGVAAGPVLERATREAAYGAWLPGHRLLATAQSRRGPLDVIGLREQASLYRHGHLDWTSPDPEGAALRAHLALCLHPAPRRVFLAGGGPGVIREMLLEPVERIDVAEPDPEALAVALPHLAREDREALGDPRVRVLHGDPRFALPRQPERYDVVAILGMEPSTVASNRFYTVEFFRAVAPRLADGGILLLSLRGCGEYLAEDLLARNATLWDSLVHAGLPPDVVPGEAGVLVGAGDGRARPSLRPEVLAERFRGRGIRGSGMAADHFHLLLPDGEADRHREAIERISRGRTPPLLNEDAAPVAVRETLSLRSRESGWLLDPWAPGLLVPCAGAAVLLALVLLSARGHPGAVSTATTGLCGMGAAVIVLMGYQSARGELYGELGLLAGLFMAGIAAGSFGPPRSLALVDLLFAAVLLGIPTVWRSPAGCHAAALIAGLLTGATFPAAVAAGGDAARLYAVDLAGSALGALLVGTVLLPGAGLVPTAALLAALKLLSAAAARRPRGRAEPPAAPASPG